MPCNIKYGRHNVTAWWVCAVKVTPLYHLPFLEYFWSFCLLLGIAAVCDLPWPFSFTSVFDGQCPCRSILRNFLLTLVLQQVTSSVTTFGTAFSWRYWSCYGQYINGPFMADWWLWLLLTECNSEWVNIDWCLKNTLVALPQSFRVLQSFQTMWLNVMRLGMIVVASQWEWLGYAVGGAVGGTASHIKRNESVVGCEKWNGRKEIIGM